MIQNCQIKDKGLQNPCGILGEPMFSIITPTYNCKSKLDRTAKSVLSQSFGDFEYLLMDGDSRDGTREWLSGLEDPRVRTLSEPDAGVYDAMNKGIRRARGKYLYFLGAGDELLPGVLQEMICRLPKTGPAMIYGNVWFHGRIYDGEFSKGKIGWRNIGHQAIFYSRDVFRILGCYDLKYKTAADWAFNISCFGNSDIRIQHVPIDVAIFEEGGISSKGDPAFDKDRRSLIRRHMGRITVFRSEWFYIKSLILQNCTWWKTKHILKHFIPPIILKARNKLSRQFRSQ